MSKTTLIEAGKSFDAKAISQAIYGLESPKAKRDRERATLFQAIYPAIRDRIEDGVSVSAIIKMLAEYGMSLNKAMFEDLLAAEASRRGEQDSGKDLVVDDENFSNDTRIGNDQEAA